MNNKKEEHESLEKKPIFQLWEEDLDAFLVCLAEVEDQEEKDRVGMGVLKGEGGKKKRNVPIKKKGDIVTVPKPKVLKPKEQPDEYVPLAQRLAQKQQENTGMKSILDGMGEASKKAVLAGVGVKRPLAAIQTVTQPAKQPSEKN